MKLVRYGAIGQEKPGLIDKSGQLRDLSAQLKDLSGDAFSPASLAKIAALDPASLPAVSGKPRIGSPVGGLPKFIAIGLNFLIGFAGQAWACACAVPAQSAREAYRVRSSVLFNSGMLIGTGTAPGIEFQNKCLTFTGGWTARSSAATAGGYASGTGANHTLRHAANPAAMR